MNKLKIIIQQKALQCKALREIYLFAQKDYINRNMF